VAGRDLAKVTDELREARLSAGLTQRDVAAAIGVSQSLVARVESAALGAPDLRVLGALASVVGLRLRISLYPDGDPLRDVAQVRLLESLRARLPAAIGWRTEVPIPLEGDPRAWDAVVMPEEAWGAVEAESRLRDAQATQRRIELKRRDDPRITRLILLVADTANNRAAAGTLRRAFPLGTRDVLDALCRGRLPDHDGIVLLRPSASRTSAGSPPPARLRPHPVHTGAKVVDAGARLGRVIVDNPVGARFARR
jgi:transcriptional regulator with XRE-family HTH domain